MAPTDRLLVDSHAAPRISQSVHRHSRADPCAEIRIAPRGERGGGGGGGGGSAHVGTGAAVVEPGATDSRCAWLHSEELALPSWPELPQILPDLTLPPLPRLIRPGLERLRSLADEEMRIAAAAGATQGNKQLRRIQADANIVPAVRWMMASTGATAGAALALGVASAFWRRSGRVRHRMKQTSSHGKPPSSASTP